MTVSSVPERGAGVACDAGFGDGRFTINATGRRPFVWLASYLYLKSGNTWTRLLLANFLADSEQAVHINRVDEALPGFHPCDRGWFDRATGLPSSDCTADEIELLLPAAFRAHAAETAGERQFCKVHDALHDTAAGEPLFPADVSAGAVCLVRNPLDVAVSLAFHYGWEDFSEAVTRMNDRRYVMAGGLHPAAGAGSAGRLLRASPALSALLPVGPVR